MTEPSHADPMIGTLLDGRYAIEQRIARGGMATIYLATDTKLRRRVAVKVLYPHLAEDPAFVHRFEAEAISAAKLSHPHVVSVHDQGVDGDTAYLVMEYVPGATLRDIIRTQGRLSPRATLQLLDALLSGLAAAHDAGLVHRDVKPENVLLAPDGRIKVTDFGLARAASTHTATGALIGTVAYVSPELVTGNPADTRSDLYAVGVLMYELLTGQQPFSAETGWQVALKHVNESVPSPGELVVGLAPDLDEVVAWCTRHDPEERPHDAQALRDELDHIQRGLTPAQLDLGEPRTTIASLLASTIAVLKRGRESEQAGSEAGTTVLASPDQDDEQDATRGVDLTDPEAATQAVPRGEDESTNTRALPSASSAASAPQPDQDEDRTNYPHHTVPRLPRDTAQVPESAEQRPLSNREERAARKAWAKNAQRPTEELAKPGTRKRALLWTIIAVIVAACLATAGWFFGAGPGGKVLIPEVQGQKASKATADLSDQGLSVTRTEVFDEKVSKGDVVGTDPPAGESIRKFTPLTLTVSKGPELHSVPNIVGLTENEATKALKRATLEAGDIEEVFDESMPAGKVTGQGTDSGQRERAGTKVPFTVSKGPSPVSVPDLVGRSPEDAEALLKAAGLGSVEGDEVYSDEVDSGRVAEQDTSASDEIDKGSDVTWHLSKGRERFEVPDVTGKPLDEAQQELEDAGFKVKVEKKHSNPFTDFLGGFSGHDDDVVSEQDPDSGKLAAGQTVTLRH